MARELGVDPADVNALPRGYLRGGECGRLHLGEGVAVSMWEGLRGRLEMGVGAREQDPTHANLVLRRRPYQLKLPSSEPEPTVPIFPGPAR